MRRKSINKAVSRIAQFVGVALATGAASFEPS
jgi:hypothetical protein